MSPRGAKKKVSANGLITVCRAVYIHYFKMNAPTFCCPLFSEIYFNSQDQQNSKQIYCQLLITKFLWMPKGFISPARVFLEFSPKPVYSTMVAEKFQIYSVKITGNTLVSQKLNLFNCTHASKQNHLQLFIIILQANGNCPFLIDF